MAKYRCPDCGDADNLLVNVITSARLIQSHECENFETEVVGDHEWDNQSTMWCASCGTSETASSFQSDEEEVD